MGIRIDALPPTIAASKEHVVPSMRDGITVKLSVGQINDLGRLATALESGTDFDDITSPGLYAVTSDVNAPLGGGRWLVACNTDPDDASSVFQTAMLLSGGMAALTFTRRSVAGVFGAWSGGQSAADISFDDAVAFPGATNVQQALEMSAAWIGAIRDVLMLQEFVAGLTLGNWWGDTAKANYGVTIAAGQCRGNGVTASKTATWAKMLNDAWVQGFGYGGLDTGTIQPNTTYHCHAIRQDSTGDLDFLFSTSATSPVMPSGWTRVQRLGAIMTDGSGNIRPFVQDGNEFRYAVSGGNGVSAYGSTVGNRAYSLLTCPVPTGVRLKLLLLVTLAALSTPNPQDGGEAIFGDGDHIDVRMRIHRWGVDGNTGAGINFWTMDPVSVRTNTSGQINFGLQAVSGSFGSQLFVLGWVDESIPRIGK